MNPIDLVTPDLGMIFWTSVLFLALVLILSKTAWGPITKALETREHKIADDIKRAETARIEAERARDEFLKEQQKHLQEANDRIAQMMRNAESRAIEIAEHAKQEANKTRDAALADIELERQKAVSALRSEVVAISIAAAQSVIGREIKPEDHRALIEKSIPNLN